MRKLLTLSVAFMASSALFLSCQKDKSSSVSPVSEDVLTQIKAMGFSTDNVTAQDGGYIVEGDIFLSPSDFGRMSTKNYLIIAQNEQYRTTNLVTGLPRTIKIALDSRLAKNAGYTQALAEVARRYNAENLVLTFQVVTSGADITFVSGSGSYLASAGFPTSTGAPFNQVKVNSRAIGTGTSTTFINYLASIMAHEAGHCIGFRHTDYMDRSYSCGGATTNEGASTVGAIHIAGTPTTADAGSWMLACIGSGVNRPFNNNDKSALNTLY